MLNSISVLSVSSGAPRQAWRILLNEKINPVNCPSTGSETSILEVIRNMKPC